MNLKQLILTGGICLLSLTFFAQTNIRQWAASHHFNGVILVEKNGKTMIQEAYGVADRRFNVPNSVETPFKIASVTKWLTAVLVLQLYEADQVDLNQPIGKYLPAYRGEGREKITVHHLLTHSSGLPNLESKGLQVYELPMTADSIVKEYCSGALVGTPGTAFSYNNGDYILLGQIVEAVCKKPYTQVLSEKILNPCGMKHSGLLQQADIIPGLASTYLYDDSTRNWTNDAPFYINNYGASGAMYSTAGDVAAFVRAVFSNRLLQPETVKLMTKSYPEFWNTAYSVWVTEQEFAGKKATVIERYGSIQGANALISYLPQHQMTVVLLSNTNATDLGQLKNVVLETVVRD